MNMHLRAAALICSVSLTCIGQVAMAACADDSVLVSGEFGQVRFNVDVVDTPQERGQGLMNVPQMPTWTGMLFVYEAPQSVAFWMKNTLIPLDMIFADETGTIQLVHSNAVPGDLTPIPGGDDILLVLEINGGLSERLGIQAGAVLRHSSIDPALAAMPCADNN